MPQTNFTQKFIKLQIIYIIRKKGLVLLDEKVKINITIVNKRFIYLRNFQDQEVKIEALKRIIKVIGVIKKVEVTIEVLKRNLTKQVEKFHKKKNNKT